MKLLCTYMAQDAWSSAIQGAGHWEILFLIAEECCAAVPYAGDGR